MTCPKCGTKMVWYERPIEEPYSECPKCHYWEPV